MFEHLNFVLDKLTEFLEVSDLASLSRTCRSCHVFVCKMVRLLPVPVKVEATNQQFQVFFSSYVHDTRVRFPVVARSLLQLRRMLCKSTQEQLRQAPYFFLQIDVQMEMYSEFHSYTKPPKETRHNGSYNPPDNLKFGDFVYVCPSSGYWNRYKFLYKTSDGFLHVEKQRFYGGGQILAVHYLSPRVSKKRQHFV